MTLRFEAESREIHRLLVAELGHTVIPAMLMGVALVGVGVATWHEVGDRAILLIGLAGGAAALAKLIVIAHQRRAGAGVNPACRELAHAITTYMMAASVAMLSAALVIRPDPGCYLAAMAVLFGYCCGLIGRLSIRPWIAAMALLIAMLPVAVASALIPGAPHRMTAVILALFFLNGLENVRHVHGAAVRQLAMRLDLARLARNDPLTGLLNRLGLREAFDRRGAGRTPVAIHCLDLDGFKSVNDRHGHAAGDAVLIEVAERLRAAAGAGATIARLGGDEFVIVCRDIAGEDAARALANRMLQALRVPFAAGDAVVRLGASVGYVVGAGELDDLLQMADDASYRAKRAGGGMVGVPMTLAGHA
ncbi:GGDEF domain-containing protein [Sphingomonas endophytica]|uniref:GGDEF domain-containing protein n=1 Tax=Sphingomonas endophytica TaxID=869719 RepID=A0A147I033_9SPHN|nr:GGDEF domain-containing protein [Sphingomonas endophytica]KTT70667.1 hypothetical protein NS334_11820 [Sphingomonas endophytica]